MTTNTMTTSIETGQTRRALLTRIGATAAFAAVAPLSSRNVSAQESTPAPGVCGPVLGTAIPIISVEGTEVARITVNTVTDPFTGYNPSYPPPRGNRFLLISLTVENTGPNVFGFDPGRTFLQDTEGFIIWPSGVDLGAEPAEPGIGGYQELPPAGIATGVIGYVLIKGVTPERVFWGPASDRLILLANLA